MRREPRISSALVLTLLLPIWTGAEERTFDLELNGAEAVPGPGDQDGQARGTLTINDETGYDDEVWPLVEGGAVRPVIHRTFPLRDAAAAHALMESSGHIGKIVLTAEKTPGVMSLPERAGK